MGQSGCCTASSAFCILPCHISANLYFENRTVLIQSPVFCFLPETDCNIFSYCQCCGACFFCLFVCFCLFVVVVFYDAWIALISSKYKPQCHTFISDLLYKLMGKSASSDFWACSEKKIVVIFLFSQYSPRNSFVNAASECPLSMLNRIPKVCISCTK